MPQPTTLIVVTGLSLVGAAIGVGIGRSALDQINPANFKDSDTAFYSDPAPDTRPSADWAQLQAQEYRAASQAPAPQSCVNCSWPVAPVPPQDPTVAHYDQPRTAAVPRRAEAPTRIVVVEQSPEPDWGQVERYTQYPIARSPDPAPSGASDDAGDGGTQ